MNNQIAVIGNANGNQAAARSNEPSSIYCGRRVKEVLSPVKDFAVKQLRSRYGLPKCGCLVGFVAGVSFGSVAVACNYDSSCSEFSAGILKIVSVVLPIFICGFSLLTGICAKATNEDLPCPCV